MLKPGDKVITTDKYYLPVHYRGKVWTVRSEPFMVCGNLVVLLEGKAGGYIVDGLKKIGS